MNKNPFLFVYGSLRKGFQSEAYSYISSYFELLGDATIKGLLYDLGEYPAAIPTNDDKYLKGELYKLKDNANYDWAFAQLDDYEGVIVESDEQQMYRRDLAIVYQNNLEIVSWVYWYNANIEGKDIVPSGDIFRIFNK